MSALFTFNAEDPAALQSLLEQAFQRLAEERKQAIAEIQATGLNLLAAVQLAAGAERKTILDGVQAIVDNTLKRLNGVSLNFADGE